MLHTVKGPTMACHLLRFQSPGNREETQESFGKEKKKNKSHQRIKIRRDLDFTTQMRYQGAKS